jgi:uncharacterized protein (TIGR02453 family)
MSSFFDFLQAISINNNRPWLEENRKWYDRSRSEFLSLIDRCIAEVGKIEDLGDLDAKKAVFRIYRDVRFSKNKDPFKNNFSASLAKGGKKEMKNSYFVINKTLF